MTKPQVSPECQQYMKVCSVDSGSSSFISHIKRNLMDVSPRQVSGGAYNRKRGLQLLRKCFPISVLWGSIVQLAEVIIIEGHL